MSRSRFDAHSPSDIQSASESPLPPLSTRASFGSNPRSRFPLRQNSAVPSPTRSRALARTPPHHIASSPLYERTPSSGNSRESLYLPGRPLSNDSRSISSRLPVKRLSPFPQESTSPRI